jgi:hypothetical protein
VFKISAAMARQGGWAQLVQSDRRLVINKAKLAQEGFPHTMKEETEQLIRLSRQSPKEMMQGVELPVHHTENTVIKRHPPMVCKNKTASCLPCQNGTAKLPQTPWRSKGTGAPPHGPSLPQPDCPLYHRTTSQRDVVTHGSVYIHEPIPSA